MCRLFHVKVQLLRLQTRFSAKKIALSYIGFSVSVEVKGTLFTFKQLLGLLFCIFVQMFWSMKGTISSYTITRKDEIIHW